MQARVRTFFLHQNVIKFKYLFTRKSFLLLLSPVVCRIRIHWFRIRSQHFRLNTVPVRIQDWMTKNWKNLQLKKILIFFRSKIAVYLFRGLLKRRPNYKISLHHSKENIHHFKTCLTFSYFCGSFLPNLFRIWNTGPYRTHQWPLSTIAVSKILKAHGFLCDISFGFQRFGIGSSNPT